jgi:hypothetical protein
MSTATAGRFFERVSVVTHVLICRSSMDIIDIMTFNLFLLIGVSLYKHWLFPTALHVGVQFLGPRTVILFCSPSPKPERNPGTLKHCSSMLVGCKAW